MFQEALAERTADHLRTHIEAYVVALEAEFTGANKLRLRVPEVTAISLVGGVMQAPADKLPLVGVDCLDKRFMQSTESLNLWEYDGAIVGMASGSDEEGVDKAVKRYQRACELFVRTHQLLHQDPDINDNVGYSIREFFFSAANFSGVMQVNLEDEEVWVGGFTNVVTWITSEDGETQHL